MPDAAAPAPRIRLALRPDAERSAGNGALSVRVGRLSLALPDAPGVAPVLDALEGGVLEDELRDRALESGGVQALFALQRMTQRLDALGALTRTLEVEGEAAVELDPLSPRCPVPAGEAPAGRRRLSRFALARREGDDLVLDCARGHGRVRLAGGVAGPLLSALAAGTDVEGLAGALGGSDDAASWALRLLDAAGALTEEEGAEGHEDADPAVAPWEVHDLLFHTRSRLGRQGGGYGGTYRFRDRLPEPPVLKAPMSDDVVALPRPDLDALRADDAPFTAVLERRRSLREHGEAPLTLEQLGHFLYRTARVKAHHTGERGEVTERVYPGGGALYELEVYPVVDRCEGLESGLYRYDPLAHALERVTERTPAVEALLLNAYYTADQRAKPHVLLALTARFQRMQWKYEGMAYAAILKHVGVLYQTFYLVASAMGLAPCALGGGDSDLFARAAGLDYMEETTVGEFILGAPEAGA